MRETPQLGHLASFRPTGRWGMRVAATGERLKTWPQFSHRQSRRLARKNWVNSTKGMMMMGTKAPSTSASTLVFGHVVLSFWAVSRR